MTNDPLMFNTTGCNNVAIGYSARDIIIPCSILARHHAYMHYRALEKCYCGELHIHHDNLDHEFNVKYTAHAQHASGDEDIWQILYNFKIETRSNDINAAAVLCKHCNLDSERVYHFDEEHSILIQTYLCPRVIETCNEYGYSGTTVCLDCILEAAKGLDNARA